MKTQKAFANSQTVKLLSLFTLIWAAGCDVGLSSNESAGNDPIWNRGCLLQADDQVQFFHGDFNGQIAVKSEATLTLERCTGDGRTLQNVRIDNETAAIVSHKRNEITVVALEKADIVLTVELTGGHEESFDLSLREPNRLELNSGFWSGPPSNDITMGPGSKFESKFLVFVDDIPLHGQITLSEQGNNGPISFRQLDGETIQVEARETGKFELQIGPSSFSILSVDKEDMDLMINAFEGDERGRKVVFCNLAERTTWRSIQALDSLEAPQVSTSTPEACAVTALDVRTGVELETIPSWPVCATVEHLQQNTDCEITISFGGLESTTRI